MDRRFLTYYVCLRSFPVSVAYPVVTWCWHPVDCANRSCLSWRGAHGTQGTGDRAGDFRWDSFALLLTMLRTCSGAGFKRTTYCLARTTKTPLHQSRLHGLPLETVSSARSSSRTTSKNCAEELMIGRLNHHHARAPAPAKSCRSSEKNDVDIHVIEGIGVYLAGTNAQLHFEAGDGTSPPVPAYTKWTLALRLAIGQIRF